MSRKRTSITIKIAFALLSLPILLIHKAEALDYQLKALTPHLVQDGQTSFLLDLSAPKSSADFASGSGALDLAPGNFVAEGGYRGAFTIPSAGNIDPGSFTVEAVVKVAQNASSAESLALGGWLCSSNCKMEFLLDSSWGARGRAYLLGYPYNTLIQPFSGGNGFTIRNSATDRWIYLSYGFDFALQKSRVVAREMDGSLINQNINFVGADGVDKSFLQSYPADQRAAQLALRWNALGEAMKSGLPSTVSFGGPDFTLKALRISRGFRDSIFSFSAETPTATSTTWIPNTLDPTRTISSTNVREVGYPGYHNTIAIDVTEEQLRLTPGSSSISLHISNLPIGLYSLMLYGAVEANGRSSLDRVWRPTPMKFEARDDQGKIPGNGRMLLKQSFVPRRMQGFHFHVDRASAVTATFTLPAIAQETALIQKIELVDQLKDLPDVAIKKAQNFEIGKSGMLSSLTSARIARDNAIWNALPPLNTHLQVHGQVAQFNSPPSGIAAGNWVSKYLDGVQPWNWASHTFDPLDFLEKGSSVIFPNDQIVSDVPWPSTPADDGTGVFYDKATYPALATSIYNSKRAELLGARYLLFAGSIMDSRGSFYGAALGKQYFTSGDPEIGHDGAMALIRWVYDWPALEMSLHEQRLSTHSPDFEYNVDWSDGAKRNGKMYYQGWSGSNTLWLFETYDQLFPYIKDNQLLADEVHRFIPWISTPSDVIRFLDRYLVFASIRDVKRGLIDGESNIEDSAATLLGPDPATADLLNLTKQSVSIYPLSGTYQNLYATALSRSGSYYIASFLTYAFGDAQNTINKAYLIKKAKDSGVPLAMDISNVERYAKVRGAGDFLVSMWVAGGFPFMIGDASGGPHSRADASTRVAAAKGAFSNAFALYHDPRHALILKNYSGATDPQVVQAAQSATDPILHATSRVIPDYGAVIETGENQDDQLKKSAMTMRLGIGQGHAHNDYLDLNIFGMGLPLAVDLACRNEGTFWSRPGANWSFLHNHALAHATEDPKGAGDQTGEPWLRSFAPPLVQASYLNYAGDVRLDRDSIMMQVGDSDTYYVFDVQRLRGNALHTWAFHGVESTALALNVPMSHNTVRWIDRTLADTHYTGVANDQLQATWTATRSGADIPHTFNGGGVIHTVGVEPTVLGTRYDASLAPVNVRSTLLGHAGDTVLQGNPFSQTYAYSFPFLWVQRPSNNSTSVYPALYEWYRGATPVIRSSKLISQDPVVAEVTLTNGQIDTFHSYSSGPFSAISRDNQGIRWAKFVSAASFNSNGVTITSSGNYQATITAIDYNHHTLSTSVALPKDPYIIVGNSGRTTYLQLTGSGTNFTWRDDLLIHEGQITALSINDAETISLATEPSLLFDGSGNRKSAGLTVTNEDASWQFRNGKVIKKPLGAILSKEVFSDSNNDGYINSKSYEIGIGDSIVVPAETTVRRGSSGWEVKSNVSGTANLGTISLRFAGGSGWQQFIGEMPPQAPSALRATSVK